MKIADAKQVGLERALRELVLATTAAGLLMGTGCGDDEADEVVDTPAPRDGGSDASVSNGKDSGMDGSVPADACADMLPDFTDPEPPMDFTGSGTGTKTELAVFAWQHFVALSWQSTYEGPGKGTERGVPDESKSFFDNPEFTVWETYRHRNELFPAAGSDGGLNGGVAPDPDFSGAPSYRYDNVAGPCTDGGVEMDLLGNLDENEQLQIDYMFASPEDAGVRQVLFQAKVNKDNYDYIVSNGLYDLNAELTIGARNAPDGSLDPAYGAICQQSNDRECQQDIGDSGVAGYCLPCGGELDGGTGGVEGTIHVKAAWRALTDDEAKSGRYLTSPVLFYRKDGSNVCATNGDGESWGLIGLHIIHKTRTFPAFFFASWEHVDNATSNLTFRNTTLGGPNPGESTPWARAVHDAGGVGVSLPSDEVEAVNKCVQDAIASEAKDSIWQYYQLVGVQGEPVDYADRASALPDYFLANNVIESNAFFQSFNGSPGTYKEGSTGPDGTTLADNVTIDGSSVNVGGCQGCHGNAQQMGFDMSFLGADTNTATAIDDFLFDAGVTP